MDTTDILLAVRSALQNDAALKQAGVKAHAVLISENGDIAPGTPLPALSIEGGQLTQTPRDMTGRSEWATFEVIVHVFLEDFSRAQQGPDAPSLALKALCQAVRARLYQHLLNLALFDVTCGAITFPNYTQRNFIDRWEGRIPVTYRWIIQHSPFTISN